ncbi:hypothetical protein DFH09DRAFT_390318 [Mycena vulgaris]|nr:hypothetical protein DFH09DRAFT_390318 [Mycena vulgaris]
MALFTSPSRLYNRPSHPSNPVLRPLVLVFYPPAPSRLFSFYIPFVVLSLQIPTVSFRQLTRRPGTHLDGARARDLRCPLPRERSLHRHAPPQRRIGRNVAYLDARRTDARRTAPPYSVQQQRHHSRAATPTRLSTDADAEARTSPTTTAVRRAGAGPAVRRRAASTCVLIARCRSSLPPLAR